MPKIYTRYTCQQCGFISPKYMGRCPQCDQWNTFVESADQSLAQKQNVKFQHLAQDAKPVPLSDITQTVKERIQTNLSEFDYVLGGGLVPGQVLLLAGEPGVGKSTLLLQIAKEVNKPSATNGQQILYASGEESPEQIGLRAKRLGFSHEENKPLILYPETNVERIIQEIERMSHQSARRKSDGIHPQIVIIDSIQTMYSDALTGAPGSVGQVRECAYALIQSAKRLKIPMVIVGQVTKDGAIAGPKILEHLVDTVLYMEGSRFEETRIVRVSKNRFGPTDEAGVFTMKEDGLYAVKDPSLAFHSTQTDSLPGQVAVVVMEGTRPLIVQFQALVAPSELASARRVGTGVSFNRLTMLCAILAKHVRLPLERFDVYVNVSGGLTVSEPAADLGIALSIYSSFKNKPIPPQSIAIGELSLLGQIQEVSRMPRRVKEAKRMGFTNIYSYKRFPHLTAIPFIRLRRIPRHVLPGRG